jgi:hypothetical protein
LYLAVLARPPSAEEKTIALEYVKGHQEPTKAFADLCWVLLNSTEFVTIH